MNRTTTRPRARTGGRLAAGLATVVATTLALALPAWAHVDAELGDVSQTGLAEITFSFHHGCDGAATTGLRIQIPDGVSDVTPTPAEGFSPNVSDTEFGWSGGSIPDGQDAAFIVTLQLSGKEGDVIAFPTIQQCGEDEIAWIEPPSDDESEDAQPAPSIVLPATYVAPTSSTTAASTAESSTTASTAPTGLVTTTTLGENATPETTETNTAGLVVFIVIVVIIVGGALYLYFSNRRPRPPAAPTGDQGDGSDSPDGTTPDDQPLP